MSRPGIIGLAVALTCSAFLPSVVAQVTKSAPIHRMYVFGDSYSDIGEGYLDGNGPTAVAYLAQRLGFNLVPANAANIANQSLDFAISGAQTGSGTGSKTGSALLGYGMRNQVDDFAAKVNAHAITFDPKTALFFIAGGFNDRDLPSATTVANLTGEIKTLYGLGARRFAVALLPTAIPAFSAVGKRLNPEIARIPEELSPQLAGAQITLSHWGLFYDDVIQTPTQYGIRNTTDACAGRAIFKEDATPCASPGTYFYYHHGHPSTATHKAVGDKLYEELEHEPAP
ncbi:MAG TPA: SGNH/GDSL hydrolase family protein [Edaphobacter sp.]|nr:SGNH/GDSL hydrolase family protein [Edaphobacter sp.]